MFVVRFLILLFLVCYSWGMGQIPPHGLNEFGKLVAISFFIVAPALYLLPTFEAWKNEHPNLASIAILNIFLGWSLLGWVIAIIWAFKKTEPLEVSTTNSSGGDHFKQSAGDTKKCPYCAESIKSAAILCRFCGKDFPPGPATPGQNTHIANEDVEEALAVQEETRPRGMCSNCSKIIPLDSLECVHCHATFQHGSKWEIL